MQVAKWGNSLAVRLPKKVAQALGLKAGDEVELVGAGASRIEVVKRDPAAEFLRSMQSFRLPLPKDFRFDRDEANER